jgi:hypothetical protein
MRHAGPFLPIIAAACGWLFGATAPPAAAQQSATAVDVALVLAVDASGSIDPAEFQLQKEGIAAAILDADVLAAIRGGRHDRIAIALVEWGSPGGAALVVDWMLVGDESSAEAFAGAVLAAPRSRQSYNALGDAITLAGALIGTCPCKPTRRVIDVSGDNPDNRSHVPAPIARDAAIDTGITINALAILNDDRTGSSGRPYLVEIYERDVIGGFGAFVTTAATRADFARALRQKMILEIAGSATGAESTGLVARFSGTPRQGWQCQRDRPVSCQHRGRPDKARRQPAPTVEQAGERRAHETPGSAAMKRNPAPLPRDVGGLWVHWMPPVRKASGSERKSTMMSGI